MNDRTSHPALYAPLPSFADSLADQQYEETEADAKWREEQEAEWERQQAAEREAAEKEKAEVSDQHRS